MGCPGVISVPDPITGKFDSFGSFRNPSVLNFSMGLSYDVSNRITTSLQMLNIFNTCFGGSTEPWTSGANRNTCSYTTPNAGFVDYGANVFNPGTQFSQTGEFPYAQLPFGAPFEAVFNVQFKL